MFLPTQIDTVLESMRTAKVDFFCNTLVVSKAVVAMGLADLDFQRFDKTTEQKLEKAGFELIDAGDEQFYYLFEAGGSSQNHSSKIALFRERMIGA